MALPLQFAYRTAKSVGVVDADPVYKSAYNVTDVNCRCAQYSPCGRWWAWASPTTVTIIDTTASKVVMTLELSNVYELAFSPRGTYLSTWERPSKDEAGDATKNFKVWQVTLDQATVTEPIGRFVQKQQDGWNLHYTADEKYCARMVTNEVQFYESSDLKTVWNKLRVEGVRSFSLSPENQKVAVYIPQKQGQPAAVRIFSIPEFARPLSQKTFFKGDKVKLFWNHQGTSLLVRVQTEVDKSNKNYYGETMVYLMSSDGSFDSRVTVDKEGPIHDVGWSPNGKEFGLVYGSMPSKAGIFNHRGVMTHAFAMCPRNTIIFSPTGRFVLVAGFGNLNGDLDVYDLEKDYRKLATFNSGNPSVCEWSNDSRYILTATLSPRLRVENGVKIWHVTGTLIYNQEFEEMYTTTWRPILAEQRSKADPLASIPAPHSSAAAALGKIKTPSKPVGAYRPPGARGSATPLLFKREDEGGAAHVSSNNTTPSSSINGFGRARRTVPGADISESTPIHRGVPGAEPTNGDDGLSKSALKNKKKRGNKKKEAEAGANGDSGGASLAPPREHTNGNGSAMGGRRSPDRRGNASNRQHRSVSRNPGGRSRSNTQRGAPRVPPMPVDHQGGAPLNLHHAQAPAADAAAADNQNPHAKKIRSLQKKVRAIEDLEMRQANNEKLEDTQIQKIKTKDAVMRELYVLEASAGQ